MRGQAAAVLAMKAASGYSASTRRSASRAARAERSVQRRILLVDGDTSARRVLHSRLSREGYQVEVAQTRPEAFERLFSWEAPPLAVVVCADAPEAEGFALTCELRRDIQTADVPVILIGREDAAEQAAACGADAYLRRPVYVNDVTALVKLEESRGRCDGARHLDTRDVPLHLLVRALLTTCRSARLSTREGQLVFSQGRLISATHGDAEGEIALRRMLLFFRGECTVTFGAALAPASLSVSLEDLCERVVPAVEGWRRMADERTLRARWAIDFRKLARTVHLLPEGMSRILRTCDGRRTVEQVILESGLDEAQTLEALVRLRQTGVLAEVDPAPADARVTDLAERLGERAKAALTVEEGLAPELQQQLRAFNIRPVRELPAHPPPVPAASPGAAVAAAEVSSTAEVEVDPAGSTREPGTVGPGGRARAWGLLAVLLVGGAGLATLWPRGEPVRPVVPGEEAPAAERIAAQAASTRQVHPRLEAALALLAQEKPEEAAALLEQVVREDPALVEGWVSLAHARLDAGDAPGAERAARAALQLSADHPRALIVLATIYLEAGKRAHAAQALRRYVQVDPEGAHVGEALQILAIER